MAYASTSGDSMTISSFNTDSDAANRFSNSASNDTTTPKPERTVEAPPPSQSSSLSDTELGIIVGGGFLLLVLVSILYVGHKRRRRISKSDTPPISVETTRRSPGSIADDHELYVLGDSSYLSPPISFVSRPSSCFPEDILPDESYESWKHPEVLAVRVFIRDISLDELVARSTNSEVYRGQYMDQIVAIKKPLPHWLSDPTNLDAFFLRVRQLASPALTHPRIVSFLGVSWRSLAYVCMVSEFMNGGDLRSLLSRRQNQPGLYRDALTRKGFSRQKIYLASQVASALSFLHTQGLVHGAIRSRNVLLDDSFNAKLTGFQGSGVQSPPESSKSSRDVTISPAPPKVLTTSVATGVVDRLKRARSRQDALWSAPEVLRGERSNTRTDIFSFGVVLSELDTLAMPYGYRGRPGDHKESAELLEKIAATHVHVHFSSPGRSRRRGTTPPTDLDSKTAAAVVRLGKSCVALDPLARPSAAQVSAELQKFLQSLEPHRPRG